MTVLPGLIAFVLVVAVGGSTHAPSSDEPPSFGPRISGAAQGSGISIDAKSDGVTDTAPRGAPRYLTERRPLVVCGSLDGLATSVAMCVDGVDGGTVGRVCEDGSAALDPLFRRELDPVTGNGVGPWVQVDIGGAPRTVAPCC